MTVFLGGMIIHNVNRDLQSVFAFYMEVAWDFSHSVLYAQW